MVDEISDVLNKEEFFGLYQVETTKAEMLIAAIPDVLQRLNISTTNLRGLCYDGASGSRGGVPTQLQQEPRATCSQQ